MPRDQHAPERLPALLDCAALARELEISRTAAERIMRYVPKQKVPGLRKLYVRRDDVRAFLEQHRDFC